MAALRDALVLLVALEECGAPEDEVEVGELLVLQAYREAKTQSKTAMWEKFVKNTCILSMISRKRCPLARSARTKGAPAALRRPKRARLGGVGARAHGAATGPQQ